MIPRRHRPLARLHAKLVLGLLVLAVMFRSMIPPGFMPDSAALRDGRLELALCSAAGVVSTMTVDLSSPDDHAGHDESQATAADTCPYWTVAHLALDLPAPAPLPVLVSTRTLPLAVAMQRALPPLPALGPPLGSRAPPSRLG